MYSAQVAPDVIVLPSPVDATCNPTPVKAVPFIVPGLAVPIPTLVFKK